jgi:hypothetical protein
VLWRVCKPFKTELASHNYQAIGVRAATTMIASTFETLLSEFYSSAIFTCGRATAEGTPGLGSIKPM